MTTHSSYHHGCNNTSNNYELSCSQTLEMSNCSNSRSGFHSQQEHSQTQMTQEILTQNADLTQMGDDDDDEEQLYFSPLNDSDSPVSKRRIVPQPWGRLMPCQANSDIISLLPRSPNNNTNSKSNSNSNSNNNNSNNYLFLQSITKSDIFNEYTLGRSTKCDIRAFKPFKSNNDNINIDDDNNNNNNNQKLYARQEWAYGMISNRHCKIYCMLDEKMNSDNNNNNNISNINNSTTTTTTTPTSTTSSIDEIINSKLSSIQVYIEDCSGNGTLINQSIVLRKGEKRILHPGDEICLVNPSTLRKKIRSERDIQQLIQPFSYVFVINNNNTNNNNNNTNQPMAPPTRKTAVDVRLTKASFRHVQQQNNNNRTPNGSFNNNIHTGTMDSCSSGGRRRISPRLHNTNNNQQQQQQRRIQEDYDIRDTLGTGTVGEVRRAIHRQTGKECAVKIISLKSNNNNYWNNNNTAIELQAEATILQQLQHPYIVQLYDVYTTTNAIYLVMELMYGGDLFDRIIQKIKYTETATRQVIRRLLSAIYYLHEIKKFVHRDLKPENILLSTTNNDIQIKITDFGLAKSDITGNSLKTFCGTPQYFAPEVLRRRNTVQGNGRYGKQADMWSLGVILYVLLTGMPPFDPGQIIHDAEQIDFPNDCITSLAKDLILQLLQYDPRKRITVVDACKHPWILIDDGDTHVHPLDDPVLQNYNIEKGNTHATANDSEQCQATLETGAKSPHATDTDKTTISSKPNVSDNKTAEKEQNQSKCWLEEIKTEHLQEEEVNLQGSIPDQANIDAKHQNIKLQKTNENSPVRISATNFSFQSATRRPLLPKPWNDSDQNTMKIQNQNKAIEKRNNQDNIPTPIAGFRRPTPSPHNNNYAVSSSVAGHYQDTAGNDTAIKNNDDNDDVISEFSDEKTESISSFSNATLETTINDEDNNNKSSNNKTQSKEVTTTTKRVFDQVVKKIKTNVGNKNKNNNKKRKANNNANNNVDSTTTAKSNKKQKTVAAGQKRKQTTLSNFFKKT